MTFIETPYEDLLADVLENGVEKTDRTGVGTISTFGRQIRFPLAERFPLITTKRVFFKGVVAELLWLLSGSTNVKPLQDQGVHIWDEWADKNGDLGPVYGKQWRGWQNPDGTLTDQISEVMTSLRENPNSRRHVVSAWNPGQLRSMALPPCHALFQFYVAEGRLSCQLYQRSADMFLGVPFNIASYSLLTMMIAHQLDLELGEFIWTGGDVHIYTNHVPQVKQQLARISDVRDYPTVALLRRPDSIFDYQIEDIQLQNYRPHPAIKAEVAV